jgi:hypothetical protein
LSAIDSEELLDEFLFLFPTLAEIHLTEDRDVIAWKWTMSGEYTAASTYEAQFLGAFPRYCASSIWKARAQPRCRFFAWLTVQGKAPTADILMAKNWSCDPDCPLCFCLGETNEHLLTVCNFTEAVWDLVAHDLPIHYHSIMGPLFSGCRLRAEGDQRSRNGFALLVAYLEGKKCTHFLASRIVFPSSSN